MEHGNAVNIESSRRSSQTTTRGSPFFKYVSMSGFPPVCYLLLGCAFFQSFASSGVHSDLILYFRYYLLWSNGTSVYYALHVVGIVCVLLGAEIADNWLEKPKTFVLFSLVSTIGFVLNTMGAISPIGNIHVHEGLSDTGIALIAIGFGGASACLLALGGDQFPINETNQRRRFYSLFFMVSVAAKFLAYSILPVIKDEVMCFGDDCYALLYGITSISMILALVLAVCGFPAYVMLTVERNNTPLKTPVYIWKALRKRSRTPANQRNLNHWMDYALDGTNDASVKDVKRLFSILVLYVPLMLFWVIIYQLGGSWYQQADKMDWQVGSFQIYPDQITMIFYMFEVFLILLLEFLFYPLFQCRGIKPSPLLCLGLGMTLYGFAFLVAAIVQVEIDNKAAYSIQILWMIPQYIPSSLGDIFVTVFGLEFSYSQAPKSMKSIVEAIWIFNMYIGQMVTWAVDDVTRIQYQAGESFLLAGLVLISVIAFTLLAKRYDYSIETLDGEEIQLRLNASSNGELRGGNDNPAYRNDGDETQL